MHIHQGAASDGGETSETAGATTEKAPEVRPKKPRLKRFTIDLSRDEHRVLKGEAVKAGISMRALALQILHGAGVLGKTPEPPLEPEPEPAPKRAPKPVVNKEASAPTEKTLAPTEEAPAG